VACSNLAELRTVLLLVYLTELEQGNNGQEVVRLVVNVGESVCTQSSMKESKNSCGTQGKLRFYFIAFF